MSLKQVFIRNLKNLRKIAGLSQMQLSLDCELSPTYIGEIEMGRKFPSVGVIEKIAAVLRVPPHLLFFDEQNRYQKNRLPLTIPPVIQEDIIAKLPEVIARFIRKY
jgi:transcriptional regulator with XRE-family HTH domain